MKQISEYEITPPGKFNLGFKELWDYKELFYFFTWRDIKVKYKQTLLGFAWAVLQPLLLMVIFTLFFGQALGVPSDGAPYPVFVFTGLLLWNIFATGLNGAANSMVTNANIIKKIYFPRLIIPVSSIFVALFDFIMAFVIYILLLIIYKQEINSSFIIFLPLSLTIIILTTIGLGALIAALNVKYRDFRYIIPFLTQVLFFLTPVIYPASKISSDIARTLLSLNPMTAAIDLFRSTITNVTPDITLLITGSIMSVLIAITGLYYFKKTEYYFADLV